MKNIKRSPDISFTFKSIFFFLIFILPLSFLSQIDSNTTLTFDFNDHQIKEKNNLLIPKPVGVSLTYDRFGNENSALYIHGHAFSYLNLGTSKLLKPTQGSISMWVNLERRLVSGKGYDNNPLLFTKNSENHDFYDGYIIGYEGENHRFGVCITLDSTKEVMLYSTDKVELNHWNHFAMTFDNMHLAFYVNGKLQGISKKDFQNIYSPTDSVMVGILTSKKNQRYSLGIFDDIQIMHRVLTPEEVTALYEAPNPNKNKNIIKIALICLGVLSLIVLVSFLLVAGRRKSLKRETEKYMVLNKMNEMEMKLIKSQMNPHFISNCLVAIQNLIYNNKIEKAGLYVAKFSYYLRQVLSYSNEDFITLTQEIEMINLYVELEQLRFESEFKFDIIKDDNINFDETLAPALITQPFIENAIWHGLLPLKDTRPGKLTIRFIMNNGLPTIEIEDNGVGRDSNPAERKSSMGTLLATNKMEGLNRLANTSNYKIKIVDLFTSNGLKSGTKIIIRLDL